MKKQTNPLKDLAIQVAEIAKSPKNEEIKKRWIAHNSMRKVPAPVYVRINCWQEIIHDDEMIYKEGILRQVEFYFRSTLYNASLNFDFVVDPYVTIPAVFAGPSPDSLWGLTIQNRHPQKHKGAWGFNPSIIGYKDIEKLRKPVYCIDESKTKEQVNVVREMIGDDLDIRIDYGGPIGISASLGNIATALRGFQQLMTDVIDNPDWVHQLMRFLMEGHIEYQKEMERQNKVTPNHNRWPFYHEPILPDYDPNHVRLRDCWGWGESQEFDLFSPAMFEEFLLAYQIPIFELTSLNNYGCCENLTHKYSRLKKVPGLRRVSVSPWTDFAAAVDIMGGYSALNWRYSPAEVIFGFDEDKIRSTIETNLTLAKDVPVEIVLQDIETLAGQPERIKRWVEIAKEVAGH